MELGINRLWPTEILYDHFDDFSLLEKVQNFLLGDQTSSKINVMCEDYTLFEDKNLQEFENKVRKYFDKYFEFVNLNVDNNYFLKGWTRGITDRNTSLLYHNHNNSTLSSIFYLFVDEKMPGGEIVFHDPRLNANRGYFGTFKEKFDNKVFKPKTGDILIFPSFLYHHVDNFNSNRIAVSVDLILRQ